LASDRGEPGRAPDTIALPAVGRISPSSIRRVVALAGAVGAEEAVYLAPEDVQVEALHRDDAVAIVLRQARRLNHLLALHGWQTLTRTVLGQKRLLRKGETARRLKLRPVGG